MENIDPFISVSFKQLESITQEFKKIDNQPLKHI